MPINGNQDTIDSHFLCYPPLGIHDKKTGTSGTYQATEARLNKLHEFVSLVDCVIEGGTGSSVTIGTGRIVVKGEPVLFVPVAGFESLGYKTASGDAFSSTEYITICLREP